MCMCGTPTINGTPGAYSWDGKSYMTASVNPPDLQDGDELICDEPGRCGGIDAHSHHFRLVKRYHTYAILVRHGGGDERFALNPYGDTMRLFDTLDSNGRYWLLHSFYSTRNAAVRQTEDTVALRWRTAAAEKRIKTRKVRGRGAVKVWIEPTVQVVGA